jgi:hypothetical protein
LPASSRKLATGSGDKCGSDKWARVNIYSV